ncbi:S-arrestin-like [Arapaima gigas]
MSSKQIVFKKHSKDKSVGVYMGKRDFVDHCDFVEPVDGVIIVDPEQLKGKKAFVTLCCTFRYGRDDMDVIGIKFRRELYQCTHQVYPPLLDRESNVHTKVQEKLLHKLGLNAYPFFFEVRHILTVKRAPSTFSRCVNCCFAHQFPDNLPCSVGLQPAPTDVGKKCAVEFEVKAFCAKNQEDKVQKRSCVSLVIRKVQYAPENGGPPPSLELSRQFSTSDKPLCVKASLEKQTYYHGETINIHMTIENNSSKTVKNIIITVEQVANVVLYSNDSYMQTVATLETVDTVDQGENLTAVYAILPLLANNREKRGIALDGKLKHEDTNLASSSIVKEGVLPEVLGILVSYRLVVKLIVGGLFGTSDVRMELPFRLMHPKPDLDKDSEQDEELVFQDFRHGELKGATGEVDEGNVSPAEA